MDGDSGIPVSKDTDADVDGSANTFVKKQIAKIILSRIESVWKIKWRHTKKQPFNFRVKKNFIFRKYSKL